jgi:hypothetical protein
LVTGAYVIFGSILRDDCMAVVNGRRGDDKVRRGKRVPRLAAFLYQKASSQHDVFSDRKNSLVKHGPHPMHEPVIQRKAAAGFADKFNAKSNLGERYSADVQLIKRLTGNKLTTSVQAWAVAIPTKCWCRATTPSEHDVAHR